jgi:hypothetical protein
MTEEKTFTAITTQEEFDERIKGRLAREREKWEKESGTEDLQARLAGKDQEIADLKREHDLDNTRRALLQELARRGVDDEGRRERVLKLVDLGAVEVRPGGEPDREQILSQIDGVASDIPELVRPRGAASGGSKRPVLQDEKPLTREELEAMSESEINSRWEQIKAFMAGERR